MAIDVAHRIDWIGPVFDPQMLSMLYNKASLFVYPSIAERGETFGLAPLEAMSTGCPTIVSDLHCFREYLEDGVNGHVFNHRREDAAGALCEKIVFCLSDLSRLEQIAHRGWATANSYSIERIASEYLDDFASIIKGP